MDSDTQATTDDDIVREAQERFRLAQDAESQNRTEALTDKHFRNGEQWPVDVRRDRDTDGRPCLTINLTDATVRRVINACRENRPRIKVHPVGDGADIETAQVLDGLIRHIENLSGADHSYDTALENAIDGGWGYLGLDSDYIGPDSFDQELKIIGFRNPFTCYADPASQTPDGSDYNWFIESEMMPREEYRRRFGHIDGHGWQYIGPGDQISDWSTKEEIRVAKYWRVERVKDTLHLMSDGTTAFQSELPSKESMEASGWLPTGTKRESYRKIVRCYLVTASKILERTTWPGTMIPRVPVYGRELDINGRRILKGMIRDLRDPARMFNYSETAKTETYALQPKAPWLGAEGFMEGHEPAWRDANRKPIVALEYKPVQNPDGSVAMPPMRQNPPPVGAGFQEWSESSRSNFLAVAGIPHDPDADAKGEVVSGVALKRRQGISDISHFDFYDNFCRSLRQLGRLIVEVIPDFYDTQRIQRIIREDGTPQTITINQRQAPDPTTQAVATVRNDLTVGRYDVAVDTGPGYQTKREETAEALLELVTGAGKVSEMLATSAADKIVRQFDFPDAASIADRLKSLIPAAQAEDNLKDMTSQQLMSMVAGLQQQLQQANQKSMAFELELQAKHQLEQIRQQGETQRTVLKEQAETHREHIRDATKRDDTHTRAVTAHDVAEISAAGKLLDTHATANHAARQAEREMIHAADQAERDRQAVNQSRSLE